MVCPGQAEAAATVPAAAKILAVFLAHHQLVIEQRMSVQDETGARRVVNAAGARFEAGQGSPAVGEACMRRQIPRAVTVSQGTHAWLGVEREVAG